MQLTKRCCGAAATLIVLALSGPGASASETYYRWTDASGTRVNSDRPPPAGIQYDVITTETNTTVPSQADEQGAAPGNNASPEPQNAPGRHLVIEKNPEACAVAKTNLDALNTHARIRMADGEGSFRYLNEDEKANERAQAEAAIAQNCE